MTTNNLIAAAITAAVQQPADPAPPPVNTPATPSHGFDTYLMLSGAGKLAMSEKATTATLTWQNIDTDAAKAKTFKEQALRSSSFTPFLAMNKGSHLILIIYGLTIYSAPTAIAALKDKAIRFFTGNRTARREPTVFILQQDKAWAWTTIKTAPSDVIMTYYNDKVDEDLFKPQQGTTLEEKKS